MAGFHTKTFLKFDDYMTPFSAWDAIKEYIPKDKIIWEPFYGDGNSGKYLRDLGFNVVDEQLDFFENNFGEVCISNPPFSSYTEILKRLVELDKPFILILPCSKMNTAVIRGLFGKNEKRLQLIIPRKRIQFTKLEEGVSKCNNRCNFDCFYYCWKMDLPKDIMFLN